MKYFICFLFLIVGCAHADESSNENDARNDSFLALQRADSNEASEAEVRAMLEVANTFSRFGLVAEVSWNWRAANNLMQERNGDDGIRGTEDDKVFRSLAAVDAVPYVGKKTYNLLRDFVRTNGLIDRHELAYTSVIPSEIEVVHGFALRGVLPERGRIRMNLRTRKGDQLRFWLKKADETQWNPRIRLYQNEARLFSANPWGNTDARMPMGAEFLDGWTFEKEASDGVIEISNTAGVEGPFEFTIECVSGPCYEAAIGNQSEVLDGEFGTLADKALLDQIAAKHERTHRAFGYREARDFMFSVLDNFENNVRCVYTNTVIETVGIPSNIEMNAEHTWPQSKGAKFGVARADLHHIYPVTSYSNSMRSAFPYCNVDSSFRDLGDSILGFDTDGNKCFQPPAEHRGDTARSMFYFASAYGQTIDDKEERVLREWNIVDPVDENEMERSRLISEFQGSKNDFVLDPELIDRIANF